MQRRKLIAPVALSASMLLGGACGGESDTKLVEHEPITISAGEVHSMHFQLGDETWDVACVGPTRPQKAKAGDNLLTMAQDPEMGTEFADTSLGSIPPKIGGIILASINGTTNPDKIFVDETYVFPETCFLSDSQ